MNFFQVGCSEQSNKTHNFRKIIFVTSSLELYSHKALYSMFKVSNAILVFKIESKPYKFRFEEFAFRKIIKPATVLECQSGQTVLHGSFV